MRAGQVVFILVSISLFAYGVHHYQSDHVMTRAEELQSYGPGTRMRLVYAHPNVKIDHVWTNGCPPTQVCTGMFELVRVTAPHHVFELVWPNQLQGYVTIATRAQAVSFVRLPYNCDALEVIPERDPSLSSSARSGSTEYAMESDKYVTASAFDVPGLSPAVVTGDRPPFRVRRWMWPLGDSEVQLWEETVGADGAYSRTILVHRPIQTALSESWKADIMSLD